MSDKLFRRRLSDLTDQAVRNSLTEIQAEFDRRFGGPETCLVCGQRSDGMNAHFHSIDDIRKARAAQEGTDNA